MQQILEAVYERGVFRPLTRPSVADGQHVRLTVESPEAIDPDEMLALAARVLQNMAADEVAAFEAVALDWRTGSSKLQPHGGWPRRAHEPAESSPRGTLAVAAGAAIEREPRRAGRGDGGEFAF